MKFLDGEPSPYRTGLRRTIPHEVQEPIRQGCGEQLDEENSVIGILQAK